MRDLLKITKALADETRLKILIMLGGKELCVCRITEGLRLAPSTVSKHLSILQSAGLIETHKIGRWVHCCLPATASRRAKGALTWVFEVVGKTRKAR